ncbi:hypothetical protein Lfu02_77560 [Longispora fulva]|uniref:Dipeptidyl aminopeptidase/acylaminoacyl peptidase n=1 Tax=Longispora fulva TaxID=619741 RepID=A0A8J7KIG5_9ACTN|nr:hypothetical protein [Longispora fulva]MBG6136129.1 dipeptidyl aminopeptidase/acylaminoacyl peptidase [Longispora fulva]GIG63384.1 hypothetical protein Lfu02_77560 [Longispora fulva]
MTDQRVPDGLPGFAELVPVHPNMAAAPAPRRPRRAWLAPAVAAAAVLAVLTPVVALPDAPPPPRPANGGITLPRQFPAHSTRIPLLADKPTGPAIAFYRQTTNPKNFYRSEAYVAGATTDGFRRLGIEADVGARLSPDGTRLALGDCSGSNPVVTLVDLATDQRRTFHLEPESVTTPRAWSPDGRYLVVTTYAHAMCNIPFLAGPLWLMDTETGRYHELAAEKTPRTDEPTLVAFSPDGGRLAVQTEAQLTIMDLEGRPIRELDLPPGQQLAGAQAWSPDGSLLALTTFEGAGFDAAMSPRISFLDATGTGAAVPAPVHVGFVWSSPVLGWKDPGTFLVLTSAHARDSYNTAPNAARIVQVHTAGGAPEQLAALGPGPAGWAHTTDIQLAGNLVPVMGARAGPPADAQPQPYWLAPTIVACVLTLLASGWLLVRRLRSRAWSRSSPRPGRGPNAAG